MKFPTGLESIVFANFWNAQTDRWTTQKHNANSNYWWQMHKYNSNNIIHSQFLTFFSFTKHWIPSLRQDSCFQLIVYHQSLLGRMYINRPTFHFATHFITKQSATHCTKNTAECIHKFLVKTKHRILPPLANRIFVTINNNMTTKTT